ncbi:hypothetical protein SAMN06296036_11285 [Pseudobacteriovorax antillogorgiicola]|uniref:Uncharacterized protein n=1 Tax=Pseudobacteriovorax antillogorgiicola TaxID=1513793 RepID=A0A1Y6C1G2_9BACT|nr:hypothetical protein EDD56_11286 [Pseudobacteriovorax antillogorgiicola]SMF40535.1 hypothetical protein SAMN06296036_11285 [Pseudobacteriovorax antillogorgiicola]
MDFVDRFIEHRRGAKKTVVQTQNKFEESKSLKESMSVKQKAEQSIRAKLRPLFLRPLELLSS